MTSKIEKPIVWNCMVRFARSWCQIDGNSGGRCIPVRIWSAAKKPTKRWKFGKFKWSQFEFVRTDLKSVDRFWWGKRPSLPVSKRNRLSRVEFKWEPKRWKNVKTASFEFVCVQLHACWFVLMPMGPPIDIWEGKVDRSIFGEFRLFVAMASKAVLKWCDDVKNWKAHSLKLYGPICTILVSNRREQRWALYSSAYLKCSEKTN